MQRLPLIREVLSESSPRREWFASAVLGAIFLDEGFYNFILFFRPLALGNRRYSVLVLVILWLGLRRLAALVALRRMLLEVLQGLDCQPHS